MNSREKLRRDDQIVTARMRGLSWSTIAATYDLSERQCQEILTDYRESHPRLRERDPIDILDDMLDRYDAAQEELALVSATTRHDATRVGAIRTRLDALAAQANLLMAVGVLPRNLGVLRDDIDAREIARALVGVIERYDIPHEAQQDVLDLLDFRTNGATHRALLRGPGADP
jgi:hypothetical protein